MVRLASQLIGVSLVLGLAQAAPVFQRSSHSGIYKKDSSSGVEVAVSAPNGIVESDTAELASQLASETGAAAPTATVLPSDGSGVAPIDATDIPTDLPPSGTDGSESNGDSATAAPLPSVVSAPPPPPPVAAPPPPSAPPSLPPSYNMPSYGSGYSSWMVSYNECVQTCMATYPPPPIVYSPPSLPPSSGSSGLPPSGSDSSVSSGESGSLGGSDSGSGDTGSSVTDDANTLNVVVAPHQGVLRYVPPLITASVGQTVKFTWGAGPHTVTQSSQAAPCNHSIGGFQSGQQNATATFTQVVNDTNPVFFYCGVPTHCQKGMFGAINPPTAPGANTSVAAMMPQWAAMDADIMAAMTTLNNSQNLLAVPHASTWGDDMDVSGIDPSFHVALAKDILFTRMAMAMNPQLVSKDGVFNPTADMKVPTDISSYLDAANQGSGAVNAQANVTTADSSATDGSASGTQSSSSPTAKPNGAVSMKSSGIAIALAAVVAVVFAL